MTIQEWGDFGHRCRFSVHPEFSSFEIELMKALAVLIAEALEAESVRARNDRHDVTGTAYTNICNQGKSKAGVQLELTEALRASPDAVAGVVRAVRRVLMQAAGIIA